MIVVDGYDDTNCYWCGEEIEEAYEDLMLTTLFGYVYCSEKCRDEHVDSK